MQDEVKDIATGMYQLLSNGWTQGAQARDYLGTPCSPHSHDAIAFCLMGAAEHTRQVLQLTHAPYAAVLKRVRERIHADPPVWNDHPARTHNEVMAVISQVVASFDPVPADVEPAELEMA